MKVSVWDLCHPLIGPVSAPLCAFCVSALSLVFFLLQLLNLELFNSLFKHHTFCFSGWPC